MRGRTIAEKIFGSKGHDITLWHPNFPDAILHYTKFSQMTDDIDDARVYGGIHFRFDQEEGARQGARSAPTSTNITSGAAATMTKTVVTKISHLGFCPAEQRI